MKVYKISTIDREDRTFSSYNILAENMEEALAKLKAIPVEKELDFGETPEEIEMIARISDI